MRTVLITGANGFVGTHLKDLLSQEFSVIATARNPNNGIENFQKLDITSKTGVDEFINNVKPDVVVHLAAMSKPDECELNKDQALLINTNSVGFLLEAAARTKSYFVFLSTDFVFDGERGMYREDDIPSPVNYYGETKLQAEELVKQYPYGWSIIRTVLVYGSSEGKRDNILTASAKALANGETLQIVNDQVRTPTYVGDLCKAIKVAIEKRSQGIFHVSGKDVVTPYEMVIATAKYLGLDEKLVTPVSQSSFTQPARRPLKTGFDISKAESELGYEPVSFEEGLKLSFYRKHPDQVRE